jgi:hypothetical protein
MTDRIEELIQKSIDLSEAAARSRWQSESKAHLQKLRAMEKRSEELWQEAKALGRDGVSQKNYENLANAIIKASVDDYIKLTSGDLTETATCNKPEIRKFMHEQTYTRINTAGILESIDKLYAEDFIPHVRIHGQDIRKEWRDYRRKTKNSSAYYDYNIVATHRCPFCKGALYPQKTYKGQHLAGKGSFRIVCRYCGMAAYWTGGEMKEGEAIAATA